MTISIIPHRAIWLSISGVLVLTSLILLATLGLRFGIDFTGGSLMEVNFTQPVAREQVDQVLVQAGYKEVTVQSSGQGYLIRLPSLSEQEHQTLLGALRAKGELTEARFDSIGPVIGKELERTATTGVVITLVLIGLYVAWAYRKVSDPVASWKYGLLTILTAFHDVIIPLGAFALFGKLFGWEVGTAFVAAILTILGYSITDTVVVFDRTRENLLHHASQEFETTVERSIHQTLWRSLSTSITTLLALLAIFLFGGETTRPFAMALMIGIFTGTYSSIFLASPLLVVWEKRRS
ncbi:protein translocase subunit SecF [Candidatus Uhrbacteria bacterium]|nr:protein translocase subunit SecF [Candidatus Uhrbacteria bacterium]